MLRESRLWKALLSVLAVGVSLSLAQVGVASAATGTPYKSGSYAKATYSVSTPAGTSAYAELQRGRWYGWENLKSVQYSGGGYHATSLSWYCKGSGTYTYRLISRWTNALGYTFPWTISSEKRFSC